MLTMTLTNSGAPANGFAVTSAALSGTAALCGTGVVVSIGAGGSTTLTLIYPAARSGSAALAVKRVITGGEFGSTFRVTVL